MVDEVDNMLQEPFIGEIETILQATAFRSRKQTSSHSSGNEDAPPPMRVVSDDGMNSEERKEEEFVADFNYNSHGEVRPPRTVSSAGSASSSASGRFMCLASATSTESSVEEFADRYCGSGGGGEGGGGDSGGGSEPQQWRRIAVQGSAMLPTSVTHGLISVPRERALDMLKRLLNTKQPLPATSAVVSAKTAVAVVVQPAAVGEGATADASLLSAPQILQPQQSSQQPQQQPSQQQQVQRALVFVNDPRRVESLCKSLFDAGIIAAPLHGDSSKDDRKVKYDVVFVCVFVRYGYVNNFMVIC